MPDKMKKTMVYVYGDDNDDFEVNETLEVLRVKDEKEMVNSLVYKRAGNGYSWRYVIVKENHAYLKRFGTPDEIEFDTEKIKYVSGYLVGEWLGMPSKTAYENHQLKDDIY